MNTKQTITNGDGDEIAVEHNGFGFVRITVVHPTLDDAMSVDLDGDQVAEFELAILRARLEAVTS